MGAADEDAPEAEGTREPSTALYWLRAAAALDDPYSDTNSADTLLWKAGLAVIEVKTLAKAGFVKRDEI